MHRFLFVIFLLIFSSCTKKDISPIYGKITLIDRQIASIPSICKREYRKITKPPVVAIVDFTNNTTFDTASLKDIYGNINYRQSTVGEIVGIRGNNIGVGVYRKRTIGNIDVFLQNINLTVKILDTQTGQVIFSKDIEGRATIGKVPILTYDAIIGGIKLATKEAIKKAKLDLSKYFSVKGYILQIRTLPKEEKRFALINLGSKQEVKAGDKFIIYMFDVIEDPISGKKECLKIKLPVYLEVTNYVQNNSSWTNIERDEKDIKRVKIRHLVEKIAEKKGKISKLFGF
ncbi:MAG TPA: hypothetical protein EYH43_06075 [Persephonella sp.]|nr:hypothetical protein [Persephonella sp.]